MSDVQSTEMTFRPGRVLGGKYRIEEVVGEGGMGIVVAARHIAMNNRVAIKILVMDAEVERDDAIARFQREARAVARIESDHVVRVIDVAALEDGTPYMVMDLLEGDDFRKILYDRGPLPISEAVGYILQACEGLSEAHAAGVVHRDLKPSNLFLASRSNGRRVVKVLDFGISKVSSRPGDVAITTTNALMGSPVYMAPEQMRSSRTVDARADVWSIGLILYELLAGEVAFGGDTIPEVCVAVMNNDPAPISGFRDDVPAALQAVLQKCMAKDREQRYPTMAALARDLAPFTDQVLRVHADRASAALKSSRDEPEEATDPEASPPTRSSDGNVRIIPVVAGLPSPAPLRNESETLKSWNVGRKGAPGQRAIGVALVVLAIGVAGVGVLHFARGGGDEASRAAGAPSGAVAPSNTPSAIAPASTVVVPSIDVESLPQARPDAGVAIRMAPRTPPSIPNGRAVATPSPTTPSAPTPSATTTAPKKDDWKWGDRN